MFIGYFFISLLLIGIIYIQLDTFGGRYTLKVKERLRKSSNFKNGQFGNLETTPNFAPGVNFGSLLKQQLKRKESNLKPNTPIEANPIFPHLIENNSFVWLGHSSLFLKIDNQHILVDPVQTVYASPVKGFNKSFPIHNQWKVEDFEHIDMVLITHDHYDHLDRQTIKRILKINPNVSFYCGLGVGMHLKRWGAKAENISELDWEEKVQISNEFKLHFLATRHFSGRKWRRNNTLWGSFMLESKELTVYLGGDSGYGTHFKKIGAQFSKIDIAFLEMGQYNQFWPYIHMFPEEVIKAALDLKTSVLIPVHHSMFALSDHAWTAPLDAVRSWPDDLPFQYYIPQIGDVQFFNQPMPLQNYWWYK